MDASVAVTSPDVVNPIDFVALYSNFIRSKKLKLPKAFVDSIFGFLEPFVSSERRVGDDSGYGNQNVLYLEHPITCELWKHFKPVAISLETSAKDQGWSSYPQEHGTREGSHTWAECCLVYNDGTPLTSRQRLYTNIHAGSEYEDFHFDSSNPLMEGFLEFVAQIQMSQIEAENAQKETKAKDENETKTVKRGSKDSSDRIPIKLQFYLRSQYPGWRHHIQFCEIRVKYEFQGRQF